MRPLHGGGRQSRHRDQATMIYIAINTMCAIMKSAWLVAQVLSESRRPAGGDSYSRGCRDWMGSGTTAGGHAVPEPVLVGAVVRLTIDPAHLRSKADFCQALSLFAHAPGR